MRLRSGRGDLINYPGVTSTRTADLITCKCMFNSVVSTPNARFCNIDLKDFYLGTPLPRPEYMRIPVRLLSKRIIELYNLGPLVHNGYVYVRLEKGM